MEFPSEALFLPDVRASAGARYESMKTLVVAGLAFLALSLPEVKAAAAPPPTVQKVDLKKYQGKWYNIARLPSWFQNECARSTATYTARPDGSVGVKNECLTHKGKHKEITGTARVVNPKDNAKLVVTFDNWAGKIGLAKGDYWILDLGPGYETAIVGTPNRKYLWILSRQPKISDARYAKLSQRAKALGFDTSKLIRDKW